MNVTTPIKVACLGAGYFAQFHYESWARISQINLVGACDLDLQKAAATGLPAFDDLSRMLEKVKPDLLNIILPPTGHADAIRIALAAGIKMMICQKPFCNSLAEASAVTAEAAAASATIVIHENFRFMPWYRVIKTALDEKLIGDIHQVTFRLRPGDGQRPDAYLDRQPYFQTMEKLLIHETGVHWVDTFRFLLGDPLSVYADLRKMNPVIAGEDAGYVIFEHENRVHAVFDGNRCLDHNADNLRRTMGEGLVEGTSGTLTLHGDGAVHHRRFGEQVSTVVLGPDSWDGFGGDCVHHLQKHVVSGHLGAGKLENTAQDYLTVIKIEEAIYASASQGRKITVGSY